MSNNIVEQSIQAYLASLAAELKQQDPALIQDALFDAESHFRDALAEYSTHSINSIMAQYGKPEDIAQYYIEMEETVDWALNGKQKQDANSGKPAGFLAVFTNQQAYKALIYCFAHLPLSIAYFGWTVLVGLTSLVASVFVVGLPVLLFFVQSMHYFALFEGRLIEALLGIRMPRRPHYAPRVAQPFSANNVVKPLLKRRNWTTGLYLLLQLPIATVYLAVVTIPLLLALALFFSPVVDPIVHAFYPQQDIDINWYWFPLTTLLSGGLLALSLFCARYLGKYHGRFAKAMLVSV